MDPRTQEAILRTVTTGLEGLVPSDRLTLGRGDQAGKLPRVTVGVREFLLEEQGIGGSSGVKLERREESFRVDGRQADFSFQEKPVPGSVRVEYPKDTLQQSPDDYTVDYEKRIVSFRNPPGSSKKRVIISYSVPREIAETRILKIIGTYEIVVQANSYPEVNAIVLEIIRTLYSAREALEREGIQEISFTKGISFDEGEGPGAAGYATILDYLVESTMELEMKMPAIDRIEIRNTNSGDAPPAAG